MTAKGDAKTKTCSRCGKRKRPDQFGRNSSHADGLQSDCRPCRKEREAGYPTRRAG